MRERRTCDTTFPGGYCTIFDCAPGSCPDEAECIAFQSVVSQAPECSSAIARPRLLRAACMLNCSSDADCRAGYVCVDLLDGNPWAARVAEEEPKGSVCMLPPPPPPEGQTQVCEPSPVEPLELPTLPDAGVLAPPDAG